MSVCRFPSTAGLLAASVLLASPASALTMKECSAKYQAAQTAGTLNGLKWNDFRKVQCGAETATVPTSNSTSSAAVPAPVVPNAAPKPAPTTAASPASAVKTAAPSVAAPASTTAAPVPTGNMVFPMSVSANYASESPGKARMHTCLDQYKANKAANANGGMNWIEKGGGYYSLCNKKLKG